MSQQQRLVSIPRLACPVKGVAGVTKHAQPQGGRVRKTDYPFAAALVWQPKPGAFRAKKEAVLQPFKSVNGLTGPRQKDSGDV